MKLFCVVLVIYVLTLFGVDGRGSGGTRNGLEEPMRAYLRSRRHASDDAVPKLSFANDEPPPPPQVRARRNAMNMSNNPGDDAPHVAPHLRQTRQVPHLPSPPQGIPMPPM
ncbi:hypothetical protein ACLKA7_013619 [Drosophila subpalustris]